MNGKDLEKELLWEAPHIAKEAPAEREEASAFCEGYKAFLNAGKTERECVKAAVELLEKAGYREFDPKASYKAGDKVYWNNRKKSPGRSHLWNPGDGGGPQNERRPHRFPQTGLKAQSAV